MTRKRGKKGILMHPTNLLTYQNINSKFDFFHISAKFAKLRLVFAKRENFSTNNSQSFKLPTATI